ncbi:hypothetical protein ACP70R_038848 [Stipagrostis hirtigluma subsp. patula]
MSSSLRFPGKCRCCSDDLELGHRATPHRDGRTSGKVTGHAANLPGRQAFDESIEWFCMIMLKVFYICAIIAFALLMGLPVFWWTDVIWDTEPVRRRSPRRTSRWSASVSLALYPQGTVASATSSALAYQGELLTVAYDAALVAILVKDGKSSEQKDYSVHGSQAEKVFNALGAVATIVASNASGLLPEIQSTLREPAARNMRRALLLQYTAGAAEYYGVSVAGYWAYGAAAPEYVPPRPARRAEVGRRAHQRRRLPAEHRLAMFTLPLHEAMDTRLQRLDEGMVSRYNLTRRFAARGLLFGFNAFVAALLPFLGDFFVLMGSFALFPLTFLFPSMLVLKIRGKSGGLWTRIWHWGVIAFSTALGVATTAAAVRLILNNASVYHFFADM